MPPCGTNLIVSCYKALNFVTTNLILLSETSRCYQKHYFFYHKRCKFWVMLPLGVLISYYNWLNRSRTYKYFENYPTRNTNLITHRWILRRNLKCPGISCSFVTKAKSCLIFKEISYLVCSLKVKQFSIWSLHLLNTLQIDEESEKVLITDFKPLRIRALSLNSIDGARAFTLATKNSLLNYWLL